MDHIFYQGAPYNKQSQSAVSQHTQSNKHHYLSNPILFSPQEETLQQGCSFNMDGSACQQQTVPPLPLLHANEACYKFNPSDRLGGRDGKFEAVEHGKFIQTLKSINTDAESSVHTGSVCSRELETQHSLDRQLLPATSSMHDLTCTDQHAKQHQHLDAQGRNLPFLSQKSRADISSKASRPPCIRDSSLADGRGSEGNSCNTVTHYATLGRKPILKKSLRNTVSVKSGVRNFLSNKHQESSV